MQLLISIPAALLGSLLGSAVRGAVATAQERVAAGDDEDAGDLSDTINISPSPVAAVAGGLAGSILGPGTAFWVGAVLGAAGMDRFDAKVLGAVGIDMDALVKKAVKAAAQARESAMAGNDATPAASDSD
ncbi:MAG TPA: hypothetical protein VFH90_06560 [Candidatus Limnocylindria bacterium]|nr:hypothetical protein [Candidatus Limnocylindria bacterium]